MRIHILVLSIVLFSVGSVSAQGNKSGRDNFNVGFSFKLFDITTTLNGPYIEEIGNVPIALRQVPSHPDDIWIYGNRSIIRTIPYDSVGGSNLGSFNLGISPELTIWRFRVRNGIIFSLDNLGGVAEKSNSGSTREINQYGQPVRGYGTSLVYYNIHGESSRKPGLIHEVDFDIDKNLLAIGRYSWSNYNLVGESGYDRWDMLEKYRDYELGDVRVIKRSLGFGWRPEVEKGRRPITMYFLAGKARSAVDLTESGKGLDLRYKNSWLLEFGLSAHFGFLKK